MLEEEPTRLAGGLDLGGDRKADPKCHCFSHHWGAWVVGLSQKQNSVTYFVQTKLWVSVRNPGEVSREIRDFKSEVWG